MRSREFDDIKKAVEELIKEKKARNEKCSVNYMEVSERVGYLPSSSVAMYLGKNHKQMGFVSLYTNPCKPKEYAMAQSEENPPSKLRKYLSKLF